MNESELRIGNLIYYKGEVTELRGISKAGLVNVSKFKHYNDQLEMDIDDFTAIPLTEEWLSKCGCDRDGAVTCQSDLRAWLLPNIEGWQIYLIPAKSGYDVCVNDEYCITTLQFIHELQNFYYSIKRTELIFK
jgi:hypothetical protein